MRKRIFYKLSLLAFFIFFIGLSMVKASDLESAHFFLVYPNYKGITIVGDTSAWTAQLEFNKTVNKPLVEQGVFYNETLIASQKDLEFQDVTTEDGKFLLFFKFKPFSVLKEGNYSWKVLVRWNNQEIKQTFNIKVQKEYPSVYIDKQGFTVIGKERFFPYGIYTGSTAPRVSPLNNQGMSGLYDLQIIKDAGYNTVLSYFYGSNKDNRARLYLKNVESVNLKAIYSIAGFIKQYDKNKGAINDIIDSIKTEPALLSWYINDETILYDKLDSLYSKLYQKDINHPNFQVTYLLQTLDSLYSTSDILGTDPYPIGNKYSLDYVTLATKKTVHAARFKAPWMVIQLHNLEFFFKQKLKGEQSPPPSLLQMRNMSYQALVNGAKGLLFFAYHWLYYDRDEDGNIILNKEAFLRRWKDVKALNQELQPLTGIILKDNKIDLKVVNGNKDCFQAWEDGHIIYLAVVNNDDKHQLLLNFDLPREWMVKENRVPNASINLKNGKLSIDLDPVACGLILLEKNK